MEFKDVLCSYLIVTGAAFLLVSIYISNKIRKDVPRELYKKWLYLGRLMNFFLVGYILFLYILLTNVQIPLELLAGSIFLGGAVFVFIVINLSRSTIIRVNKSEGELKQLNDELNKKNVDLNREINNCRLKEEQISFMAFYDSLTALPNRTLLYVIFQRMKMTKPLSVP